MKLYDYQDILTIEEVMEVLKIGRGQCYNLLNNGSLKGCKFGTKTQKIPRASVEEFIESNGYQKQK